MKRGCSAFWKHLKRQPLAVTESYHSYMTEASNWSPSFFPETPMWSPVSHCSLLSLLQNFGQIKNMKISSKTFQLAHQNIQHTVSSICFSLEYYSWIPRHNDQRSHYQLLWWSFLPLSKFQLSHGKEYVEGKLGLYFLLIVMSLSNLNDFALAIIILILFSKLLMICWLWNAKLLWEG